MFEDTKTRYFQLHVLRATNVTSIINAFATPAWPASIIYCCLYLQKFFCFHLLLLLDLNLFVSQTSTNPYNSLDLNLFVSQTSTNPYNSLDLNLFVSQTSTNPYNSLDLNLFVSQTSTNPYNSYLHVKKKVFNFRFHQIIEELKKNE